MSTILRPRTEYPLQDVDAPNLLRDQFPYTSVPRLLFDGVIVPMDPAEKPVITDTTFRDGQQARAPYSVEQIVTLYSLLHRLGGPNGVIRQSEFFLYTEKDREAVRRCQELGYRFPEITGWIRAVKDDFKLVREMGLQETGILTSCSDYHIFLKLKKNRRQAMNDYLDIVRAALDAGVKPRCHLEDLTRADIHGFVAPFVTELMKLAAESGVPIKVRLCDTMGYGVPWSEATLPRSVPKLMHFFVKELGVPKAQLEWHGHNDFHKVNANGTTAWLYGCGAVNSTLFGFGERTGNPPLEGAIFDYIQLTGDTNGIDTTAITDLARYMEQEIGTNIPSNYPFVGAGFNVTSAGIHADGVMKDEEIYNIFDTATILKRPLGVTVNDRSGVAGVAYWVNSTLGLEDDARLDKRTPGIQAIYNELKQQYDAGRTTGMSPDEMLALARKHLPEYFGVKERVAALSGI